MQVRQVYRIQITHAWWWTWLYVPGVVGMTSLGFSPDWVKIQRVAARAIRARLVLVDQRTLEA